MYNLLFRPTMLSVQRCFLSEYQFPNIELISTWYISLYNLSTRPQFKYVWHIKWVLLVWVLILHLASFQFIQIHSHSNNSLDSSQLEKATQGN